MKLDVLFVSILITFGFLILVIAFVIARRKMKTSEIWLLGFLMVVNALYIIGYALEIAAVSTEHKLIFNHVQYLGLPFIAPIWLLMCQQFVKQGSGLSWKKAAVLFIIPVATLVMNMTHTGNGLYYSAFQTTEWGELDVVVFTKGPWYYVENIYKTVLLVITVVLYARALIKSSGIRKKQSLYLLLLSVIGFVLSASSLLSPSTVAVDFICIALSASFVLVAVTLFKHELFGLLPLAYSRLFDVLDQPILILTQSKTVARANAEAARVFAQSLQAKGQTRLDDLFDSRENGAEGEYDDTLLYRKTTNGHPRYYSVSLIGLDPSSAGSARGYLAVMTDTTSHIEQIKTLETLAAGDPLTGLYNRRHFFTVSGQIFETARQSGQPVSMVMFDIDHFKGINDAFGHQAGDYVLRSVSEAISRQLRSNDVLARLGGDEFVLMLGSTDIAAALLVAERICAAVRDDEYVFDGRPIALTLSAGVGGGSSSEFRDVDELISLADNALYDAKSTGRNKVCVNAQCQRPG